MSDVSGVARELRLAREGAGLTREQAAEEMHVSASLIDKVERGVIQPSPAYVQASSIFPPAPGMYERMRVDERREVPEWFRPWVEYEEEATALRNYEPMIVPGLLQTEGYATALLRDPDRVATRLRRQAVLDRAGLTVIIEEGVLRRMIGSAAVMAEQLISLTETRAVVHVLPTGADTRRNYDGSFALAVVDGVEVGYVDTPARGFVLPDAGVVSGMRERWEELATESLPRNLSRELILKEAEQWRNNGS